MMMMKKKTNKKQKKKKFKSKEEDGDEEEDEEAQKEKEQEEEEEEIQIARRSRTGKAAAKTQIRKQRHERAQVCERLLLRRCDDFGFQAQFPPPPSLSFSFFFFFFLLIVCQLLLIFFFFSFFLFLSSFSVSFPPSTPDGLMKYLRREALGDTTQEFHDKWEDNGNVIHLGDSDFEDFLKANADAGFMVMFYAPWSEERKKKE